MEFGINFININSRNLLLFLFTIIPLDSYLKNLIEIEKEKIQYSLFSLEKLFEMLNPQRIKLLSFFLPVSCPLGTVSLLIYCSVF